LPIQNVFSALLVEFLFRLTFGVAASMAITPSRWVTSGFYRVHLWVLMGIQTLAALALGSMQTSTPEATSLVRNQFWLAVTAAAISYSGAIVWMYEKRLLGKLLITAVAGCALAACCLPIFMTGTKPLAIQLADRITSGLILGLISTAMLLGHWYLNTPTMKMEPLRRLIIFLAIAVLLRMAVSGSGAWWESARLAQNSEFPQSWTMFLALRWLTGLMGTLILAALTWQTLKIPNTQSATGILYAGVILTFIGELTSQLMSAESLYPV
jgi:hypothetical protein